LSTYEENIYPLPNPRRAKTGSAKFLPPPQLGEGWGGERKSIIINPETGLCP